MRDISFDSLTDPFLWARIRGAMLPVDETGRSFAMQLGEITGLAPAEAARSSPPTEPVHDVDAEALIERRKTGGQNTLRHAVTGSDGIRFKTAWGEKTCEFFKRLFANHSRAHTRHPPGTEIIFVAFFVLKPAGAQLIAEHWAK